MTIRGVFFALSFLKIRQAPAKQSYASKFFALPIFPFLPIVEAERGHHNTIDKKLTL
jgi:hypothetical protein